MEKFRCPDLVDSRLPPPAPPAFGVPVGALLPLVSTLLAVFVALAFWLRRNPVLLLGDLLDKVSKLPRIVVVELQSRPPKVQIRSVPASVVREQPQPEPDVHIPPVAAEGPPRDERSDEQAPPIGSVWYEDKVAAAVHVVCGDIKARIAGGARESRFFDSDTDDSGYDSGTSESSSSGGETYPSLGDLVDEVDDVHLVVPDSVARLEQAVTGMPETQRQETIKRACPRFCDVIKNALKCHVRPEALSHHLVFTNISTKNWVLMFKDWILMFKSTAVVCHCMWKQLKDQNGELYRELKESCFAEVAGQSMVSLLDVASSFCDAGWSASHINYLWPIFDTLFEFLDSIRDMPFSRSDGIQNKIADISREMVRRMSEIVKDIENGRRIRNESCIHRATNYHVQALKCFYCNKDMLQSVFGSEDYTAKLHGHWVGKLEKDAGRRFENEKPLQYVFISNNACFVSEKLSDPKMHFPVEEKRVGSVIQEYKNSYIVERWDSYVTCVEGASLRRHSKEIETISSHQRTLKVCPQLRTELIQAITNLSLIPNGIFSRSFDEFTKGGCSVRFFGFSKKKRKNVADEIMEFKNQLKVQFER